MTHRIHGKNGRMVIVHTPENLLELIRLPVNNVRCNDDLMDRIKKENLLKEIIPDEDIDVGDKDV